MRGHAGINSLECIGKPVLTLYTGVPVLTLCNAQASQHELFAMRRHVCTKLLTLCNAQACLHELFAMRRHAGIT
jgi:hypothetical protein